LEVSKHGKGLEHAYENMRLQTWEHGNMHVGTEIWECGYVGFATWECANCHMRTWEHNHASWSPQQAPYTPVVREAKI